MWLFFYEDLRSENHLFVQGEKVKKGSQRIKTISCHPLKQTMSLYKFTVAVSPAHIFKIFSTNKVGTSIQRCENFSSILRTWLRVCSVCFRREEANKAAETKRDTHGKTLTPGHLLTLPSLAPFPSNIWDNKSLLCNKLA